MTFGRNVLTVGVVDRESADGIAIGVEVKGVFYGGRLATIQRMRVGKETATPEAQEDDSMQRQHHAQRLT
jgi:hypothetical protein